MKKLILFLLLFGFLKSFVCAQDTNPIENNIKINYDSLGMTHEDLRFYPEESQVVKVEYVTLNQGTTFDVFVKWTIPSTVQITNELINVQDFEGNSIPISTNGNNALLIGLDKEKQYIFSIGYENSNYLGVSNIIYQENGIVEVTDELYKYILENWKLRDTEKVYDIINDAPLSVFEKLFFLSEFFDFGPNNNIDISFSSNTSLLQYLNRIGIEFPLIPLRPDGGPTHDPDGNPNGDPDGDPDCNCKIIATNSSAINVPNEAINQDSYTCGDGAPVIITDHDDHWRADWWFDEIRFGAAKAVKIHVQSGLTASIQVKKSNTSMNAMQSRVSFLSTCYNPIFGTPAFDDCTCLKEIDLEYAYDGQIQIDLDNSGAGWGKRNCKTEDLAVFAWTDETGEIQMESGAANISNSCHIGVDTTWSVDLLSVVNKVKGLFGGGATLATGVGAGIAVWDFVDNYITKDLDCDVTWDTTYTLIQGTKQVILKPGQEVRALMTSAYTIQGKADNWNKDTYTWLNGSGYIVGVGKTILANSGEECCKEKFASYALFSIDEFDYTVPEHQEMADIQVVSLSNYQQLVGSFIGLAGPWNGVFTQTGCCSAVEINCYTKCGFLRDSLCAGFHDSGFQIKPNSTNIIMTIQNEKIFIENEKGIKQLRIFDINGRLLATKLYDDILNVVTFKIPKSKQPRLLFVYGLDRYGNGFSKKILH